jgi:chromosomal replication initiator protein
MGMGKDYNTVWDNCLQTIRRNVPLQSFKTWFEPIQAVRLEDSVLTIQVPSKYFYEWLEEHHVALLKTTIRKELGDKGRLEYQILVHDQGSKQAHGLENTGKTASYPSHGASGAAAASLAQELKPNGMVDTESIKNPFVIPGIRKVRIDSQLNTKYHFDNYIEGDCNRLARAAGVAVAKNPGETAFNPLVIFGDTGLGKTHLAQAIGNHIAVHQRDKSVLYVSAEKFANQIIHAIKTNSVTDFVNFYQLIDVLIVDDIQFLANKHKTQEIFFHIFNQLHQNRRQVVLTSDRPPKDMEGIEDRLISRFKWGLSADLQAPDLETRMAILDYKMSREGLEIPYDVTEFICYNIRNNIRELEGVLVSLIAQSSLNKREIDLNLAKEVVRNFVSAMNREITVEFILQLVAEHFKVDVSTLQGKTRKRSIVIARQLSMYLAKNLTESSLKAIGENFGGRDHSTVIYSCRTVQDLMETDVYFKDTVAELEKKIRMSLNEK